MEKSPRFLLLDSVSRKSVLPVFEDSTLLFYPCSTRARKSRRTCLYRRGAQPAGDPGGRVLMSPTAAAPSAGTAGHRLLYPAHEQDLRAFLKSKGVAEKDIESLYPSPQRLPDHRGEHQEVLGRRKTAVVSTIKRRLERSFYKELATRLKATDVRSAFSVARSCAASTPSRWSPPRAWNYFMSIKNRRTRVHEEVGRLCKAKGLPGTRTSR